MLDWESILCGFVSQRFFGMHHTCTLIKEIKENSLEVCPLIQFGIIGVKKFAVYVSKTSKEYRNLKSLNP